MGDNYRSIAGRRRTVDDIQTRLAKYIERLPFKDASPLGLKIWKDVAGSESAATSIAWRSASASRDEKACVALEPLVDGGSQYNAEFLGRLMPKRWEANCPALRRQVYERTGFTFLIIENIGDITLSDVTFSLKDTYSKNAVERELTSYTPLSEIKRSLLNTSKPTSRSLVDRFGTAKTIEDESSREIEAKVSLMKPGSKFIMLLNIYFSDENQLPAGYFYGQYIPISVTYLSNSRKERIEIRPPYGERAARQLVPYGWFNQ